MNFLNKNPSLIEEVVKISKDAGQSILEIYDNSNKDFELKKDKSPLQKV